MGDSPEKVRRRLFAERFKFPSQIPAIVLWRASFLSSTAAHRFQELRYCWTADTPWRWSGGRGQFRPAAAAVTVVSDRLSLALVPEQQREGSHARPTGPPLEQGDNLMASGEVTFISPVLSLGYLLFRRMIESTSNKLTPSIDPK
ncbi:hypothetical protein RRG08_019997 [Elysia crispata]|uniref:Uncharacterized protein n=1 Tax=Elysia crispata TaxID=231223 RepID=A0AAE1BCN6_9GAST|nr:hypothetical protein RRG08_019997 [Elysia crispata]